MPPVEGYWGTPTSTIDWCESNYEFSYYIAEMTNTISNLMMILPPLWGIYEVFNQKFEKRFIYCHMLLLIVGLGSWAFHMTLLYEMQLFDELPMVWGISVMVYSLYQVGKRPRGRFISNMPLFLLMFSLGVAFTALYLFFPIPVLQHVYYGVLVLVSYFLQVQLLRKGKCKVCKRLFVTSILIYLFGFALWSADKIYCPQLQYVRQMTPTIFNPVTQLHGWWHCFAGYGTYLQILFTIHSAYDFEVTKSPMKSTFLRPCFLGFSLRWSKKSVN